MDGAIMARLDDVLATIEAEREARLHLETRTARLEADLCAPNERPRCLGRSAGSFGRAAADVCASPMSVEFSRVSVESIEFQ